MLHHLPYFQLGSHDDVHPYALCEGLFLHLPIGSSLCHSDYLGTVRSAPSGTVLGKVQRCAEMLGVYRQAVYAVLPKIEKEIKQAPRSNDLGACFFPYKIIFPVFTVG